jgi:hypothetical protein
VANNRVTWYVFLILTISADNPSQCDPKYTIASLQVYPLGQLSAGCGADIARLYQRYAHSNRTNIYPPSITIFPITFDARSGAVPLSFGGYLPKYHLKDGWVWGGDNTRVLWVPLADVSAVAFHPLLAVFGTLSGDVIIVYFPATDV